MRSYEQRAMRRHRREAAKRGAIAQSADNTTQHRAVDGMPMSFQVRYTPPVGAAECSGGLSPPDRRLRSATLACGSPACPERRASKRQGWLACLPRNCSVPDQRSGRVATRTRYVEGTQPERDGTTRSRELTAEGLRLEATLHTDRQGLVHVLARQTVAAHLRHVCDAKTMTALGTAPP